MFSITLIVAFKSPSKSSELQAQPETRHHPDWCTRRTATMKYDATAVAISTRPRSNSIQGFYLHLYIANIV